MARTTPNGELLVAKRNARYLTQLQAAVAIGISPQTLARAESGQPIQPRTARDIAEFYDLDLGDVTVAEPVEGAA